MKQIKIKSVFIRSIAIILFAMGTVSVSAQYYMNVAQKNGKNVKFMVQNIDSVFFSENDVQYESVDLGLSVKWATFNVGATAPEEYGDYYAWGETEIKKVYDYENYQLRTPGEITGFNYTKYITFNDSYGVIDNKAVLDPEDDVASVMWGDSWRMPTKAEQEELINNCTWTWTNVNGINGYRVTSNIAGYTDRSIFLPAAGWVDGTDMVDVGVVGNYESSSLEIYVPLNSYYIEFGSDFQKTSCGGRGYGVSVRPVCSSAEWLSSVSLSFVDDNKTLLADGSAVLDFVIKKDGEVLNYWPDTWVSDNPSVAIVNQYGAVTAISAGTAHITASVQSLSAECTVTVIDEPTVEPEYVDLGLSVKWATFNIGALSPEDFGAYFAWGETESKAEYDWENYKWCNGSRNTLTKYCVNPNYGDEGFTDDKTALDAEDDVAHAKWGGNWRMPTQEELNELIENCTWTWNGPGNNEFKGVAGYKVTSNMTGFTDKYIFIPASGSFAGPYLWGGNEYGYILSSSLSWQYLYLGDENYGMSYGQRQYGCPVRPVCP